MYTIRDQILETKIASDFAPYQLHFAAPIPFTLKRDIMRLSLLSVSLSLGCRVLG